VRVSPSDIGGQLVWLAQYIATQTQSSAEFYAIALPSALVNASDSTFKALWTLDVLGLDVALYGATVTPPRMAYLRFTSSYTLYRHTLVAKRATLPVQAMGKRLWLWLRPFSWDMWLALIGLLLCNSAVYMWFEHSTDVSDTSTLHRELRRSRTHAVSHATFLSSMSVVGTNNNVPTTMSGRIHQICASFSLWVIMAAYLANLASQLTTRPTPFQRVQGFSTFSYQPLCVRNNSIQLHFMATEYPNIQLHITGATTASMLQAVADGSCLGGLEDELLLRWLLGPGDPTGLYCGIDYVGLPSSTAYPFGLPVSAAVTDAQLAAMSSTINGGLYSGSYAAAESVNLPTSRDVCDGQLAEARAVAAGSGSASLSARDLSGILLVYAAAVTATSLGRAATHSYRRLRRQWNTDHAAVEVKSVSCPPSPGLETHQI
jgi:Ligand-gated ion channel